MDSNQINNQEFVCLHCKKAVLPLKMGVRNHCPHCLYSLHLDIFPNDNANHCHGLMPAVATMENEDGEMLLVHKCELCGKTARAVVALDDNYDEILKILPNNFETNE